MNEEILPIHLIKLRFTKE